MKKKTSKLIFFIITVALFCIFFISCIDNKKLPQKNLQSFSTSSCYIYINIKYKDSIYIAVIENNSFYEIIKNQNHWGELEYVFRMTYMINHNKAIDVNEKSFKYLKNNILVGNYKTLFDKVDIIKDTNLIQENRLINPKLDNNKKMAIIYTLLKKNVMNCCSDCESGVVLLKMP